VSGVAITSNPVTGWRVLAGRHVIYNAEAVGCERRVLVAALARVRMRSRIANGAGPPLPARPSPKVAGNVRIGRPATHAEDRARDIDVGPDGVGLPPGKATARGRARRSTRRAAPAATGKPGKEGPNDVLVAGFQTMEFRS
jgi:cytochrome c